MMRQKYMPMELVCYHCQHIWLYKGQALVRTTCPQCHKTVNIRKSNYGGWEQRVMSVRSYEEMSCM